MRFVAFPATEYDEVFSGYQCLKKDSVPRI